MRRGGRIVEKGRQAGNCEREREVLTLVAAGYSNKEIGQRLSISGNTARFHVTSILAKLGARRRTEAIGVAIERGLL